MCYQEKRTIVSMISTLLITGIYFLYVFQMHQAGRLDSTNVFKFWGSVILILIPVLIVAKIIIFIVFSIINYAATRECEASVTDELDRLIQLKSTRNTHWVFSFGFLLSMASLVMDMPPSVMFVVLIASCLVSDIVGELSQLYFYRRGI